MFFLFISKIVKNMFIKKIKKNIKLSFEYNSEVLKSLYENIYKVYNIIYADYYNNKNIFMLLNKDYENLMKKIKNKKNKKFFVLIKKNNNKLNIVLKINKNDEKYFYFILNQFLKKTIKKTLYEFFTSLNKKNDNINYIKFKINSIFKSFSNTIIYYDYN